jgi:N-acetylmuramoyl-L-alanine amidase
MTSLHIATSAMTTAQCVGGGHDMVSRLKSRLVKSRRRMRILVLSSILLTLTVGVALQATLNQRAAADPQTNLLKDIKKAVTGQETYRRTRFVIGLRKPTNYRIRTLDNPRRVIIDMPKVAVSLPKVPPGGHGLVTGVRVGNTLPGQTSVIVNVATPVVVEHSAVKAAANGTARLKLTIAPFKSRQKKQAAFDTWEFSKLDRVVQPPVPQPATSDLPVRSESYRPLIVLDPGHGGRDFGAHKFGVTEKDLVLAFAKLLRKRLLKTGRYRIAMTRDSDVSISVDHRREFAEEKRAALFISLHADYANSRARGAVIYSLRKRVAHRLHRAAADEAANEVLSDRVMLVSAKPDDLGTVQGGDLAQREVHINLERTNVFTQFAIAQMGAVTTMRWKPHREANFTILKTAKVPSVLIELAYVSNRHDAALLRSHRWRNQVAGSLVTAIEKYFAHPVSQIPH